MNTIFYFIPIIIFLILGFACGKDEETFGFWVVIPFLVFFAFSIICLATGIDKFLN
jgi:hypothetical protein